VIDERAPRRIFGATEEGNNKRIEKITFDVYWTMHHCDN
jgi:hypothetical protein